MEYAEPQKVLKDLGLDDKEVKVYLTLLGLESASVLEISQKSGVKRPTAYLILESLEEKGLVARILKGKKILYSAQHPRKLLIEAEIRLKELKEAMPQLESLLRNQTGRPRVMIYEGKDELDRAYDESFVTKGEVIFMGTLKLSQEAFPRTFKKFEYANLSPEFRTRELIDESEESRIYTKRVGGPYREVRFIPTELLPFEADIGVFGNRALITSVRKEYFTVMIESDEISRAFRTIFEVMWQAAKI